MDPTTTAQIMKHWQDRINDLYKENMAISQAMGGAGGSGGIYAIRDEGGRKVDVTFNAEVARIDNGWLVRLRNGSTITFCKTPEEVGAAIAAKLVDQRMNGPEPEVEREDAQQAAKQYMNIPRITTAPNTVGIDPYTQYGTLTSGSLGGNDNG